MKKLMLMMMVSVLATAAAHAKQDDKSVDCKDIVAQVKGGKAAGSADDGKAAADKGEKDASKAD